MANMTKKDSIKYLLKNIEAALDDDTNQFHCEDAYNHYYNAIEEILFDIQGDLDIQSDCFVCGHCDEEFEDEEEEEDEIYDGFGDDEDEEEDEDEEDF